MENTISTKIKDDANFINLRSIELNRVNKNIKRLLIEGEEIVYAFATIRDQVIFTDKRIIVVNVQGLTGLRTSYFSYPYSKIMFYGIETPGLVDLDGGMQLVFNNGMILKLDFRRKVDIEKLSTFISKYVLA